MNILVALLVFIGLTLAYGFVMRHWGLRGLTVARAFEKPAVFCGEEGSLTEVVVNDRPLVIPWLRVESRIPAALRFGRQENLDIAGDMYHHSLFTVMPWQRITRRHRVRFLRRGVWDVGRAALTVGDITGFFTCTREQEERVRIVVWPRLLPRDTLPEPVVRQLGSWALRRASEDPFLTRGIRPYLPGDPIRDIHWPATARTGEPQVRLHDPSAQIRLLVLLNGQLTQSQWADVSEAEQAPLEDAISLAATLCLQALRAGMAAGYAANLADAEGQSACSLPACGPAREEQLLTGLAEIRLRRTVRFETFLRELKLEPGLSVLLLSAYDGEDVQQGMQALRRQGCDVMLVPLERRPAA